MAYTTPSTVLALAAQAASGQGPAGNIWLDLGGHLNLTLNVTALTGGTTPAVTVSVQWSTDGTTWASASPADAFAAVSSASTVVQQFTVKAPFFRVAWTSTGTPTSVTFGVTGYITT